MNGVTVKRLGDIVPGTRPQGGPVPDFVDGAPIVLWARGDPAAVLLLRSRQDGHDAVVELAAIPESVTGAIRGGAGALRVESRTRITAEGDPAGPVDTLSLRMAVAADLDGDGVDELVVPRERGGVELLPWKRAALRLPGPSGKPTVASYAPVQAQVARLEGRAVAHLLFRREVHGDANAADLTRGSSEVGRGPIEWRGGRDGTVVVTSAALGTEKQPGIYVFRAAPGGR